MYTILFIFMSLIRHNENRIIYHYQPSTLVRKSYYIPLINFFVYLKAYPNTKMKTNGKKN